MTGNHDISTRPRFGTHTGFGVVLKSSRKRRWRNPLPLLFALILAVLAYGIFRYQA